MVERAIDSFVIGDEVDVAIDEMEAVSEGIGSESEVERVCRWFLWVSWDRHGHLQCFFCIGGVAQEIWISGLDLCLGISESY